MKKTLLPCLALLLTAASMTVTGQNLYVRHHNNELNSYPVSNIRKITFHDGNTVINHFSDTPAEEIPMSSIRYLSFKLFTGIAENDLTDANIAIYPNPVRDYLTVDTENHNINKIYIYDVNGKEICAKQPENNRVNVSFLTPGIYFLVLQINEQLSITKKFIKQ